MLAMLAILGNTRGAHDIPGVEVLGAVDESKSRFGILLPANDVPGPIVDGGGRGNDGPCMSGNRLGPDKSNRCCGLSSSRALS